MPVDGFPRSRAFPITATAGAVTGISNSFTVAAAALQRPTVTNNPNTGGSFAQGTIVPVSWTIPAAVATGSFEVYARTSTGTLYWLATRPAVAAQVAYAFNWTVTQPVGTGYQILVWYRNAAGIWLYSALSTVPFTIL